MYYLLLQLIPQAGIHHHNAFIRKYPVQMLAHLSDDLKWFKRLGKREKAALKIYY